MIEVIEIPVTPFEQLCRIVFDPQTREGAIIDPGGDAERILAAIEKNGLKCSQVWITHSHLDHCGGTASLRRQLDFKLYGHANEKEMRQAVIAQAAMFGLQGSDMEDCPEPDVFLAGGEILTVGNNSFSVLHTPGHSPGHLCYYCEQEKLLLAGDLLFAGSVGRTDLFGGSHDMLMSSIRDTIVKLPEDVRVLAGHGPATTIGKEKRTNPFLV